MTLKRCIAVLLGFVVLAGCAADRAYREGVGLIEAGDTVRGLARVEEAMKLDPSRHDYRLYHLRQREMAVQRLLVQADSARQSADWDKMQALLDEALAIDPANARIKTAVVASQRAVEHHKLLQQAADNFKNGDTQAAQRKVLKILGEDKEHRGGLALQRQIEEKALAANREPALSVTLQRPITLEFRETDLKSICELLSRSTGINFFFDKDVRADLRTTVFVRNTPIEDVLRFILVTNQLERKVLNENTLLIYPNTPAKVKEYQELMTKSFYLAYADVKQTANMIKSLVKTKDVFIDEKLRLVVMRDTPDAVRMAEKLVAAQDLAGSEVMLEVEVMEVASNLLTDLGIRYPSQVSYSIVGTGGTAGTMTLPEWLNRGAGLYRISVTNPLLILNLKDQLSRTNTLANPRIRVKDNQKARIHIGDRVPVITTTMTATSFVSESVSYLDVGLKLDVEPTISLANEVSIKMGLEVSNIVREVRSASGTLTYQLGTRNATTSLHLKDGETQILAGLISDDERKIADRVPGIGSLPVLGRLFSSHLDTTTKTEIVLLITPRILRTVARPDVRITEFMSGTESAVGAPSLVLRAVDKPPTTASAATRPESTAQAPNVTAPSRPNLSSTATLLLKAPAQVKFGDQFTIAVDLAGETPVTAGTFDVSYDESRLKIVKVEDGPLLRKSGKDAIFSYNVQEGAGRVSVRYASPVPIKETGTIAQITLQATGPYPGSTQISLANPSGMDDTGKSLRVAPSPAAALALTR